LAEVDAVLGGGLPQGAITELTGTQSSGRTTLALSALSEVTRQGESCAYGDVSDALNPISASALGVDLRRLLWVRTGELRAEGAERNDAGSSFRAPVGEKLSYGAGWRHPRNEAIGMHRAVGKLFHTAHQEHVDFTPRCSEAMRRERVQPTAFEPMMIEPRRVESNPPVQRSRNINMNMRREASWTRLDHALRATDLLLSTGGFRAIVLDMGDVPPEQARRVPQATWYRFRLQVEKSRTLFLLMTRVPCANSCAAVSLHCRQGAIHWQRAADNSPSLLAGLGYRVSVERSRAVDPTRKKPAASAEAVWNSATTWSPRGHDEP
jgi:recombination protein RecA